MGVYANKGHNFLAEKKYKEALTMFQLAYKRNKFNGEPLNDGSIEFNLGKLYSIEKDEENCQKFLKKAI
ncbi:hypothetical protein WAK64_16995 [Bacillus spongiae]|uniref:Tetratricopeptide repeat protein n=1 Tax=Bacillus spongiae TaxID=2683610 RepID=A0ABU8HHR5_9BACI